MNIWVRHAEVDDLVDLHRPGDRIVDPGHLLSRHHSFSRAVLVGDNVVAVFGLTLRYPGVGDVWAVVGNNALGHGRRLTRATRALVHQMFTELHLWRMSAYVRAGMPEYARWIELVGFEFEGVELRGGPDGDDLLRYRWLR